MTHDKPLMVLHIGSHKTGSTSIQHYLFTHPRQLGDGGYAYPRAGCYGEQHVGLPGALLRDHPILPEEARAADPSRVLAEIGSEVPPGLNVILSSEVFWELLLFQPEDFLHLHEEISRDWNVLVVYFARDPHDKSWSTVKHMGREGLAFDPRDVYREDLRLTSEAESRLRSFLPDCTRIDYDGEDSVRQVLEFLVSAEVLALADLSAAQERALHRMLEQERSEPPRSRPNSDFANPFSAAVTLAVSECMSSGQPAGEPPLRHLRRLYRLLFGRLRLVDWASSELPDDRSLSERLGGAQPDGGRLFSECEILAVRDSLSRSSVRVAATATGCSQDLVTVLEVLDQRLSHA